MGNVTQSTQQMDGQTYGFYYSYNLAGALKTETYPSGRVVTTSYDGANRASTLAGTLDGAQTNYVTQTAYWPHGGVYYFTRGNNVWHAAGYNNRLQMTEAYESLNNVNETGNMLSIACLDWGVDPNFGGVLAQLCPVSSSATDNGNLKSATYKSGGPGYSSFLSFTQSYAYDKVNRLTSASDTGGWSRGFGYDPNGNMWVTSNSGVPLAGTTPTSNVYTTANRIAGTPYDAAGNTGHVNGNGLVYDAESRVIEVDESSGSEKLVYDGLGQRVKKTLPSGATAYVYDAFGQLAAEYTTAPRTSVPCTTCYLSTDHLGSTRLVTDQNGNVVARHDFLPFGEEITGGTAGRDSSWGSTTDVTQKFTGQVRDQETGMDFFNARYFASAIGRFTSVDPGNAGADLYNPQSWNGYSYVAGNPFAFTDPSGMFLEPGGGSGGSGGPPSNGADPQTACQDGMSLLPSPLGGRHDYWDPSSAVVCRATPYVFSVNNRQPITPGGGRQGHPATPAKNDVNKTWSSTFPCNGNAQQLMAAMQGNMNAFAGNRGTFFAADFPTQSIRLGGQYHIVPGINARNGYEFPTGILAVTVTSQSSTGWTFTTDPSQHYFAGTVSFSTANAANGNVSLSVTAQANFVSQFTKYTLGPLIKAGENSTWNNMLNTAQAYCEAVTF